MYMFFDRLKGYFIERHCHRKHKPFYTITGNKNTLTHTPNFSETQKPTHMAKKERENGGKRERSTSVQTEFTQTIPDRNKCVYRKWDQ